MIVLTILAAATAPQCHQVHYLPDGRVVQSTVIDPGNTATAISTSHGEPNGAARSSVNAQSSSRGSGTSSSSSSSTSDGSRRSVRIDRDETGCRIVIDERP
ncbi:hypothetical protein KRR38_33510 [Novosphingobium sp. G106]|uniref:hypothetical protein n=1 Tax=Novosphingobium sp. G106 TaxID=2849500 RepID=UPI001C2DD13F|nr:hypothetical protein [Novosphingobium sp. G106]MBV1692424.1 hypothetical protein [Novosphingobium sp. G106]